MKEVLSKNNVQYLYVDICENIGKLKNFLKIRDTAEAHKETREAHRAGVPCLVIDDDVIVVHGAEHTQELIDSYHLAETKE